MCWRIRKQIQQNSLIYYFEQRFHTDFGLEENLKGTIFSKGAAIFEAFCSFVDTSAQIIKTDNLASNSQNSNPLQLVEQTNHEAKNLNFIKVDKVNFIKEPKNLKDFKLDAIIIATPTFTHFSYIKLASKYVKNIFVEKPLCANFSECKELKLKNHKMILNQQIMEYYSDSIKDSAVKNELLPLPSSLEEAAKIAKSSEFIRQTLSEDIRNSIFKQLDRQVDDYNSAPDKERFEYKSYFKYV